MKTSRVLGALAAFLLIFYSRCEDKDRDIYDIKQKPAERVETKQEKPNKPNNVNNLEITNLRNEIINKIEDTIREYRLEEMEKQNLENFVAEYSLRDSEIILQRLLERPESVRYENKIFKIAWNCRNPSDLRQTLSKDSPTRDEYLKGREFFSILADKTNNALVEDIEKGEARIPLDDFFKEIVTELNKWKKDSRISLEKMMERENGGYLTAEEFNVLIDKLYGPGAVESEFPGYPERAEFLRKVKPEFKRRWVQTYYPYIPEEYKDIYEDYSEWLKSFYTGNASHYIFPEELPNESKNILKDWCKKNEKNIEFMRTVLTDEEIEKYSEKLGLPQEIQMKLLQEAVEMRNQYNPRVIWLPFNTPKAVYDKIIANHEEVVVFRSTYAERAGEKEFLEMVNKIPDAAKYIVLRSFKNNFIPVYPEYCIANFVSDIDYTTEQREAMFLYRKKPIWAEGRHLMVDGTSGYKGNELSDLLNHK